MFVNCVACGTSLKVINPPLDSSCNIDGGIVESVCAGYGSKHDGKSGLIVICDDCLEKKGVFNKDIDNEINILIRQNHRMIEQINDNNEEIKSLRRL